MQYSYHMNEANSSQGEHRKKHSFKTGINKTTYTWNLHRLVLLHSHLHTAPPLNSPKNSVLKAMLQKIHSEDSEASRRVESLIRPYTALDLPEKR